MKDIELRAHFQEIKESLNVSWLVSSGTSAMALVVGFVGVSLALEELHLLTAAFWLLIFALLYNVVIFIYMIYRWVARKRGASPLS
jgi:type VI protein secretion system component VasK